MAYSMRCMPGRAALIGPLKDTDGPDLPGAFEDLLGYPLPGNAASTDNSGSHAVTLRSRLLDRSKVLAAKKELDAFNERFKFKQNADGSFAPLDEEGHSPQCKHPRCRQSLEPGWYGDPKHMDAYDKQNFPDVEGPAIGFIWPDGRQKIIAQPRRPGRIGNKRFTAVCADLQGEIDSVYLEPTFGCDPPVCI